LEEKNLSIEIFNIHIAIVAPDGIRSFCPPIIGISTISHPQSYEISEGGIDYMIILGDGFSFSGSFCGNKCWATNVMGSDFPSSPNFNERAK
jgi:hypothetical protein